MIPTQLYSINMREARVFNRQNPGFDAEKYITITGNYHQGCPAGYDVPLEDCWMAAFEFTGLLHNPEPKIHQGEYGFTDYTTNYGTYGKGSPCGCYVGRDDPLAFYGQGTCVQEDGGLSRERLTFVCKPVRCFDSLITCTVVECLHTSFIYLLFPL